MLAFDPLEFDQGAGIREMMDGQLCIARVAEMLLGLGERLSERVGVRCEAFHGLMAEDIRALPRLGPLRSNPRDRRGETKSRPIGAFEPGGYLGPMNGDFGPPAFKDELPPPRRPRRLRRAFASAQVADRPSADEGP